MLRQRGAVKSRPATKTSLDPPGPKNPNGAARVCSRAPFSKSFSVERSTQ